jgi:hypothetical protein
MNILLLFVSVIFISAYALYLNKKLNIHSKDLNFRENMLKNEMDNLLKNKKVLRDSYNAKLANIRQKESEIKQFYNDALLVEEAAKEQVVLLQKQISKLKTELSNARRKSKRLAEKFQKIV